MNAGRLVVAVVALKNSYCSGCEIVMVINIKVRLNLARQDNSLVNVSKLGLGDMDIIKSFLPKYLNIDVATIYRDYYWCFLLFSPVTRVTSSRIQSEDFGIRSGQYSLCTQSSPEVKGQVQYVLSMCSKAHILMEMREDSLHVGLVKVPSNTLWVTTNI